MQVEHLRCESPAMVHKDVYAHMIAYNLIRNLIAHTSIIHNTSPTRLSHKGAIQSLSAFIDRGRADELPAALRFVSHIQKMAEA